MKAGFRPRAAALLAAAATVSVLVFTGQTASAATPKNPGPVAHQPRLHHSAAGSRQPQAAVPANTWTWQNPLPSGKPLFAISCPSATTCFALGDNGPILMTSNGGGTWTSQATATLMNAISCADASTCVAVGDSGVVMTTTNAGTSWSKTVQNGGNFLAGVSCPSATVCFAVGAIGSILATSNGGATWAAQTSGTGNDLFAVSCPSTTTCYAAGASGTITGTTTGTSWSVVRTGGNAYYGIACLGTTTCIAVGQNGEFDTSTDPSCCWSPGGVATTVALLSVACQPAFCFATSVDGNMYERLPLSTGVGGAPSSTGETGVLYAIACPSATTCFAAGDYGGIFITTNGGTGWARQSSPVTNDLLSISCPGAATCFAVGRGGAVETTTNGGTTWSPQTSNTAVDLASISCPSASVCFAAGANGTVDLTTNAGGLWSVQTPGAGLGLVAIACPTLSACFAISAGRFIATNDGGTSWSTPATVGSATGLSAISCPSSTVCFATDTEGSTTNLVYKSTNGGGSWAVSFNLAGDPQAGINTVFNAIACPTVSTCYAVGGVSKGSIGSPPPGAVIAATSDGGVYWRTDNVSSLAALTGISCPNAGTCYVSADDSTILHTSDFGGTWDTQFTGFPIAMFAYTNVGCASATACFAVGWADSSKAPPTQELPGRVRGPAALLTTSAA